MRPSSTRPRMVHVSSETGLRVRVRISDLARSLATGDQERTVGKVLYGRD